MKVPDNGQADFDIDQVRSFVAHCIRINQRDNAHSFSHLQKTLDALDQMLDELHHTRNELAQIPGHKDSDVVKRADMVLRRLKRPV